MFYPIDTESSLESKRCVLAGTHHFSNSPSGDTTVHSAAVEDNNMTAKPYAIIWSFFHSFRSFEVYAQLERYRRIDSWFSTRHEAGTSEYWMGRFYVIVSRR